MLLHALLHAKLLACWTGWTGWLLRGGAAPRWACPLQEVMCVPAALLLGNHWFKCALCQTDLTLGNADKQVKQHCDQLCSIGYGPSFQNKGHLHQWCMSGRAAECSLVC
eukprot:2514768-Amphidinium_carterae.1